MTGDSLICADIGSTWTKAVSVTPGTDRFLIGACAAVPTTTDNLQEGFYAVLEQIDPTTNWRNSDKPTAPIFFSSSAKGGLNVAVIGLVPEITLHIGRLAAFSAGAKISASFPYRLTRANVSEIEKNRPDILLLSGGTDGGNEKYIIENARAIANSEFMGTIVYAGNAHALDAVTDILKDRDLKTAPNLMPDFGKLNIDPVRETIREVFLERIVTGKGLDGLVGRFKTNPVPTPLAVLNLVEAVGKHVPGWENFVLIDMGGATTDCYSFGDSFYPDSGTVLKGINEPALKRTVEGDLGMRVSAAATLETSCELISAQTEEEGIASFQSYIERISTNTESLPTNQAEEEYDRLLAKACIHHSMIRHAGTIEQVYTVKGAVWVQTGKDLRRVTRIVGTGGYLAATGRAGIAAEFPCSQEPPGVTIPLLPEKFDYFADTDYLLPLLGNLSEKYPRQAANTAVSCIKRLNSKKEKESRQSEFTHA